MKYEMEGARRLKPARGEAALTRTQIQTKRRWSARGKRKQKGNANDDGKKNENFDGDDAGEDHP